MVHPIVSFQGRFFHMIYFSLKFLICFCGFFFKFKIHRTFLNGSGGKSLLGSSNKEIQQKTWLTT
jgi:hypothetical protein